MNAQKCLHNLYYARNVSWLKGERQNNHKKMSVYQFLTALYYSLRCGRGYLNAMDASDIFSVALFLTQQSFFFRKSLFVWKVQSHFLWDIFLSLLKKINPVSFWQLIYKIKPLLKNDLHNDQNRISLSRQGFLHLLNLLMYFRFWLMVI